MPNVELANTSNAVVIYNQPEALQSKIVNWIKNPSTYDDHAQLSFRQAISRYAIDVVENFKQHTRSLGEERVEAIEKKCILDKGALKLKPFLIAKSLGCGTLGGLASAQIATQITVVMAIAACTTPAGWIGGTSTAIVYYHLDKRDQEDKIDFKALIDIEKTARVAEKMISSLEQRQFNLQLARSKTENSRLNRVNEYLDDKNNTLNAQLTGIGRDFNTARNQIDQLDNDLAHERALIAAAQTRISSLDGNIAALQQENQNLRTDLSTNQTHLTATATRIDELQRQNAQNLAEVRTQSAVNLASVQQMNRELINEMRAEFQDRERTNALKQEDRERSVAAKQIVERGFEKAIRREQEEKMFDLTVSLAQKSTAFEVLQMEHDQMTDQIGHKFDVMTQAMSRNPTESSISELLRSNDQQDVSDLDSENNGGFIEVAQEM